MVAELEASKDVIEQELKHEKDNSDFDGDANLLELLKRGDCYRKLGWDAPREVVVEGSAALMDLPNEVEECGFLFDFYVAKLLPWPLDEAYLAQTIAEFAYSHAIPIGVGIASGSSRWWAAY
ncbi:hypothetical protein [Natronorubrum sp. FCH18a]|uniref:hypothetical protein n=1 Tax=Natronorubrum sp. FCH18a TaxID=3447018 RepID=UPI003F517129